jgi:hypothetical protein
LELNEIVWRCLQHAIRHFLHVAEAITTSLAALRWDNMFPMTSTGRCSIMNVANPSQHKTQTQKLCLVLIKIEEKKKIKPFFSINQQIQSN